MKLTIETFVLRERFGDERAFEMIKAAGFDGIDYSFYWAKAETYMLGEDYISLANSKRKTLDSLGLICKQTHAPFTFTFDDTFDMQNQHFCELVRSIEFSAILGAETVVVHSINRLPDDVDFTEYNLGFYKSLEPYCAKFGIKVAVENLFKIVDGKHIGINGTPELLGEFIDKLDSPWFVGCIDIGHAAITGCEPEYFIENLKSKYLRTLHVQDTDYTSDTHTLPNLGKLDWNIITEALAKAGFDGDFNFEIFGYLKRFENDAMPQALALAAAVGRSLIKKIEKAL